MGGVIRLILSKRDFPVTDRMISVSPRDRKIYRLRPQGRRQANRRGQSELELNGEEQANLFFRLGHILVHAVTYADRRIGTNRISTR